MVVVSDTTTISNHILIDKLFLPEKLYQRILFPPSVFDELQKLQLFSIDLNIINEANWIEVVETENKDLVNTLLMNLDKGEVEAIALAKQVKSALLIIDEKLGRQFAVGLNIPIIGMIGLLRIAKKQHLMQSLKELLDELKSKAGFWIDTKLYNHALQLAH